MALGDSPPRLRDPSHVLRVLSAESRRRPGRAWQYVYLDSDRPGHRWGADTFTDVHEEFEFKTIWVAKRLRESLGSPRRSAYVRVLEAGEVGLRAAAWWIRERVAFVSLRYARRFAAPRPKRNQFTVVLGVARPGRPAPGSGGDEARAAAGTAEILH